MSDRHPLSETSASPVKRLLCRIGLHRWTKWQVCGTAVNGRLMEMRACSRARCDGMESRYVL